jgi:hypothetical protein
LKKITNLSQKEAGHWLSLNIKSHLASLCASSERLFLQFFANGRLWALDVLEVIFFSKNVFWLHEVKKTDIKSLFWQYFINKESKLSNSFFKIFVLLISIQQYTTWIIKVIISIEKLIFFIIYRDKHTQIALTCIKRVESYMFCTF